MLSACFSAQVNVRGKQMEVSCGDGSQRLRWLGHVGIARWDEANLQGWTSLGVPVHITRTADGSELDMSAVIREVLQNGEQITVETSMNNP
jgi:hypothetical protein